MGDQEYTIDDLEQATGFTKRQIRFYITKKLVPGAGDRGPNAVYSQETLLRLRAIAHLKDMRVPPTDRKMTLEEIAHALGRPSPDAARMAVSRALLRLAEEITNVVADDLQLGLDLVGHEERAVPATEARGLGEVVVAGDVDPVSLDGFDDEGRDLAAREHPLEGGEIVEPLAVDLHLDKDGRKRGRYGGRGEDDLPEQLQGIRMPAAGDRTHVPDHQCLGIHVGGADVEAPAAAVGCGDIGEHLFVDILGDALCIKLASSPGSQDRHAFGFGHQQPGRSASAFDFVGHAKLRNA